MGVCRKVQTIYHVLCISSSPQGWLNVFALKHGVVGIKGVKSGLYLCMTGEGLAYATVCRLTPQTQNTDGFIIELPK